MKRENELNKKEKFVELLDAYGGLLNDSELKRMKYHYYDDYSLKEIADIEKTSRNAVYLSIQSAESKLNEYEDKIKFIFKRNKVKSLLEEINNDNYKDKILEIKEIL